MTTQEERTVKIVPARQGMPSWEVGEKLTLPEGTSWTVLAIYPRSRRLVLRFEGGESGTPTVGVQRLIKGTTWKCVDILDCDKGAKKAHFVFQFVEKATGLAAMMTRLQGQKVRA